MTEILRFQPQDTSEIFIKRKRKCEDYSNNLRAGENNNSLSLVVNNSNCTIHNLALI